MSDGEDPDTYTREDEDVMRILASFADEDGNSTRLLHTDSPCQKNILQLLNDREVYKFFLKWIDLVGCTEFEFITVHM